MRVFAEPSLPGLELVNQLKPGAGDCPDGTRAFREVIQASFQSQPPRASFVGTYPLSCGERDLNVALHDPQDYIAAMIRQLWSEMGGTWSGKLREGTVSPAARLLYVHESEPLAELVRDINKFSNNVMARQLFLTLGAERGTPPARAEESVRVIREWLAAKKIAASELVLENGSGLSRVERISARHLATLLQAAWRSPVMPELVSSLRRHHEKASAYRAGGGQRAHQDRALVRCAHHCGLRARPSGTAAGGGDDGQPSTRAAGRCRHGCADRGGLPVGYRPRSSHNESTRRFTVASMTIGRPQVRSVSPGHLLVASMPTFEPRPETGLAKSR